jgi:hypothetical protein
LSSGLDAPPMLPLLAPSLHPAPDRPSASRALAHTAPAVIKHINHRPSEARMAVEREIVNNIVEADKCLNEASEHLVKKEYQVVSDKIAQARDVLHEIIRENESDESAMDMERSKSMRKSMTLPYSEKF